MKLEINLNHIKEGKSGNCVIETYEVPANDFRNNISSRRCPPGFYKRLMIDREVVMSNTPAEIHDHMEFIRQATGSVLINGLGLGMCLTEILKKDCITDVTVVELNEDVIKLVAPSFEHDKRVTIIYASAFDYQPPKGKIFDAVWHDIWTYICSDNYPEMKQLHRKYARISKWQDSWVRDIVRHNYFRDQREERIYNAIAKAF